MARKYIKIARIAGAFTASLLSMLYLAKLIAPGKDPYSECYEFNIPAEQLIKRIQNFKNENPQYQLPIIGLEDNFEDDPLVKQYFHIYIYFKHENQIIHLWVVNKIDDNIRSNLNLVGFNEGLELGHWRQINADFSREQNKLLLAQFADRVLNKLNVKYSKKGNAMSLF